MRVPTMQGVVERRLLINYRVNPDVAAVMLPAPFEPQLVNGYAVAGICLIRLGHMRPRGIPARIGLTSENAAHRIAVRWYDDSGERTGVYIPQRHSASAVNVALGDRVFPGAHQRARFTVAESGATVAVAFTARNRSCAVDAEVEITQSLTGSELFASTNEASTFFRAGAAGYSPTRSSKRLDGLEFRTNAWSIEPARIVRARSSLFDDQRAFPNGMIELDSALVMRNVAVEWHAMGCPIKHQSDQHCSLQVAGR
jgi:uncharacterized protein YqjF (DUF2071 family)